jgi:glycosyltransferase involved in cell wall biosynthesis
MLAEITPLVLTFNEAPNLERTLKQLAWAKEILLVDSFSTDETLDIARRFNQVRIVQRKFDSFAGQCNFGLQQVHTEWALSLDADYVLSPALVTEITTLSPVADLAGYRARFSYCVNGHPLRATLYPPRTVLYRRALAVYRDEGHGHRVQVKGSVADLTNVIFHDDRKPLDRWLSEQNRYALAEARHLAETPVKGLNRADRIRRKIILAPLLVFLYTAFAKRLILDGWPGWYYILQRTLAEIMLSLRLLESKLAGQRKG